MKRGVEGGMALGEEGLMKMHNAHTYMLPHIHGPTNATAELDVCHRLLMLIDCA